ncbi:MAG: enoyl-CoA hydratase/isomerase family protein [Acidimicrobiales bacterium]
MDHPTVTLSLHAGVGELVLNRPDKLNAIDSEMAVALNAQLVAAEGAAVRALIVRAEGRAFCAGRDLRAADPLNEDGEAILRDELNPLVERLALFPAPTFAAVQGAALGTGLGLALACDVVFVTHDASVGSPFAKIGAVLDAGAHAFLVRGIGPHRALELVYSAQLLSGVEAAEWGLVNRSMAADELLPTVRALAARVAAGPTSAFLASKRLVRRLCDEGMSLTETLAAEAAAQGAASLTADYREGIVAFQNKREPAFVGR